MRLLSLCLVLPFLGGMGVSCSTTTVEEEFSDFEPIIRSESQRQEDNAMRMFGSYDAAKPSEFQGKSYTFSNRDANLRKPYAKKEFEMGEHPYFKLRGKNYFSDKRPFATRSAQEGSMVSNWQDDESSWVSRMFSKKEAPLNQSTLPKKAYGTPSPPRFLGNRSQYDTKDYPLKIIEDPNQKKRISRDALGSLLNAR